MCGALWCLCGVLPLPVLARAAGFCLIPVWVTGGIHLDGYADTCDALSSYGDTAKKLEILKDPHCGAFAVIRLCSYFAAYFALCGCVAFTPRVGRALDAGAGGGAGAVRAWLWRRSRWRKIPALPTPLPRRRTASACGSALALLSAACWRWGCCTGRLGAGAGGAGCVFTRYYVVAKKQFGGITGDLAGWFLQKCEIWMLAALAACQWLGVL